MTIFCRPVEMLQLASAGGEPICSEDCPDVIRTLDGLDKAVFTSRRILGRGPSLDAALCDDRDKITSDYFSFEHSFDFVYLCAVLLILLFAFYFPYAVQSTLLFRQHTK